jgi:choline monooxygenase
MSIQPVPAEADSEQYPISASLPDASVYSDPSRYEKELERIFFQCWVAACPGSDLPAARDYTVWDRLRQSVVIARQGDGSIAAWHNVCQHPSAPSQ